MQDLEIADRKNLYGIAAIGKQYSIKELLTSNHIEYAVKQL